MKAGLAANLFALDAIASLGLQPAAPVFVQSVTEEECTGNGALAALVRGYQADAAIITEPVGESLVRTNVGVIWFQVHVTGHPVHVASASSGANAIDAGGAVALNITRSLYPGATRDNIDGVPTFVDAANDDLRLAVGSLGIDAADYDAYVAAGGGATDFNQKQAGPNGGDRK